MSLKRQGSLSILYQFPQTFLWQCLLGRLSAAIYSRRGLRAAGGGKTRLSMEGVVWTTETCLILTVVMQPVVDVDDALRAANVVNMIRGLQRSRCE